MNHIDGRVLRSEPDWFATCDDGSFFQRRCCRWSTRVEPSVLGTRCIFTDYLPAFDFDNAQARAWSVADALWWAKTFNIDVDLMQLSMCHRPADRSRAALTESFPEPDGGRFYLVGETFDYFDKL